MARCEGIRLPVLSTPGTGAGSGIAAGGVALALGPVECQDVAPPVRIARPEGGRVPTYSYACTACDHRFDVQQAFSDDPLTQCPECSERLRKLFGNVGVVFKGSGF